MPSPLQRKTKSATRSRDRRSDHSNRSSHDRDRDMDDGLGQYDSNNDLEDFNIPSFSSPRFVCHLASYDHLFMFHTSCPVLTL